MSQKKSITLNMERRITSEFHKRSSNDHFKPKHEKMPKQVHLTYLTEARKQPYDPDIQDIEDKARKRLRQNELH